MVFEIHVPQYPLNQFIGSFLYYKHNNPVHDFERFLPDGNVELVIDLKGTPQYIFDNETLKEKQACKNVWISGIRNKFITIPSGRDAEMFIVYFKKGRAYPFVRQPLSEITDRVVDAEQVLTNNILNIRDGLLNQKTIKGKFLYAEQQLLRQFGKYLQPNPFTDYAIQQIEAHPDTTTIKDLSRQVGYSQKYLIKLFNDHIGITPKAFLRISRFQKAINEIESLQEVNWPRIAADCGFFDQSHFIADFRSFSGFTPAAYMERRSKFLNYIPVG